MEIKTPLITEPKGLGDLVTEVTKAMGIPPCEPCIERAKRLNAMLQFKPHVNPWDTAVWPDVPEGWTREATCETPEAHRELFQCIADGSIRIATIRNGEYKDIHGFCCGASMAQRAWAKWEKLCH